MLFSSSTAPKGSRLLTYEQRKKPDELSDFFLGWRGRIRTYDPLIQNQMPYRLATRH
jgi:hypothetical protein